MRNFIFGMMVIVSMIVALGMATPSDTVLGVGRMNSSPMMDLSRASPAVFMDDAFAKDEIALNGLQSGHYKSEVEYVVQTAMENLTDNGINKDLIDFMNSIIPITPSVSA